MEIEVDFSGVDDAGFEPLPEGWYEVAVYEARLETSPKGHQMVCLELNVLEPTQYQGRKLWLRNTVDGKDRNYHLKRTLNALGIEVSGLAKINLRELVGSYMAVLVGHQQYEGKTRERVMDVALAGRATFERAEAPGDDLDSDLPVRGDVTF